MDRGAWQATVHRFSKSWTQLKRLSTHASTPVFLGFPCGSAGKESTCNAGDLSLIPGLGRSPGKGKGYPLQYSGLENSMDYIVHETIQFGEGNGTQSSTLAWKIPWTEEPGRLQSMGSQESDTTQQLTHHHWDGYCRAEFQSRYIPPLLKLTAASSFC